MRRPRFILDWQHVVQAGQRDKPTDRRGRLGQVHPAASCTGAELQPHEEVQPGTVTETHCGQAQDQVASGLGQGLKLTGQAWRGVSIELPVKTDDDPLTT